MEPGTVTLYAPLERRRPGPGPPQIVATMSTSRRVARTSWARKTVVPNQAATAVAARLPSSLSSTGSPRLSPTKSLRDNACSTGSPAARSGRGFRRAWLGLVADQDPPAAAGAPGDVLQRPRLPGRQPDTH